MTIINLISDAPTITLFSEFQQFKNKTIVNNQSIISTSSFPIKIINNGSTRNTRVRLYDYKLLTGDPKSSICDIMSNTIENQGMNILN